MLLNSPCRVPAQIVITRRRDYTMTLKQLEYFTAIAEEGTFQAAAEKLHITQPPLSIQIRLLEEEIGAPLFLRGPRHTALTDAGRLLYSRASSLLKLEHNTEQEMKDYVAGNRGTLRLGMASSTVEDLLDQLILPFSQQYPGIRFELTESNTYHLLELLQANLIDVALIRTPFQTSDAFTIHELRQDHIAAAGSSSFFRADSQLDFSMLAGMPLLIYRRWKNILDSTFSDKHLTPDYYCIADDARTCIAMAGKGLGVAIVPESALTHTDMKNLRMEYHTISNPEIPSSICLVTRASGYMSIPLQAMLRNLDASDAPVFTQ